MTLLRGSQPNFLSLCQAMSKWVIEASIVLTLFLTMAQRDSMAWSASIDPLDFHNFETSQDIIACKCNGQKADKTGERLSEDISCPNPPE